MCGTTPTREARARWTCTCGACGRKLPFLVEAIVTVKQFGYKLRGPAAARHAGRVADRLAARTACVLDVPPRAAPDLGWRHHGRPGVRVDRDRQRRRRSRDAARDRRGTRRRASGRWSPYVSSSAFAAGHRARARAIADVGRRYALGDLSRPGPDYGDDELGPVARALDGAVQSRAPRRRTSTRDRARMEAILGSMVEGVLVVDDSAGCSW